MKNWYKIEMKGSGKARIDIYQEIGGWGISAEDFVRELNALDVGEIELHINSEGGSIIEGWAMYYNIKRHKAKVNTVIDGMAASMATVIALAGDTVEIVENGWFMIHNPLGGVYGNSEDLRSLADMMDKMAEQVTDLYVAKSGLSREEVIELMDADTWMTGKEAFDKGFVDTIGAPLEMAACAKSKRFRNAPAMLAGTADDGKKPKDQKQGRDESMIDKNLLVNCGIARPTASDEDAADLLKQFVNKARDTETELTDVKASLTAAEGERDALKSDVEAAKAEAIEAKAQAAVDTDKISKEQKDAYMKLLKLDEESAEAFLAGMKEPKAKKAAGSGNPVNSNGGDGNDESDPKGSNLTAKVKAKKEAGADA